MRREAIPHGAPAQYAAPVSANTQRPSAPIHDAGRTIDAGGRRRNTSGQYQTGACSNTGGRCAATPGGNTRQAVGDRWRRAGGNIQGASMEISHARERKYAGRARENIPCAPVEISGRAGGNISRASAQISRARWGKYAGRVGANI